MTVNHERFSEKFKRLIGDVEELSRAEIKEDQIRLLYWSGRVCQAAGDLAALCLTAVANDMVSNSRDQN